MIFYDNPTVYDRGWTGTTSNYDYVHVQEAAQEETESLPVEGHVALLRGRYRANQENTRRKRLTFSGQVRSPSMIQRRYNRNRGIG